MTRSSSHGRVITGVLVDIEVLHVIVYLAVTMGKCVYRSQDILQLKRLTKNSISKYHSTIKGNINILPRQRKALSDLQSKLYKISSKTETAYKLD